MVTDVQFSILRRAVTLARERRHIRLPSLRETLIAEGNATADVEAALEYWADYVKRVGV